jgi:tetratricopeptide (TPR) repeat protein
MQRRLYEGDHPDVAQSLNNIAGCLADQGRHPEALTYYESAMAMRQRLFNDDHPDVANSLNNVAACLERVGRPAEALPKYESAGAMLKRVLPAGHPHMLYPQAGAARCLVAAGRYAEAESLLLEAAGQCERSDASRRQHGVTVLRALVALYSAWDAAEPGQGHGKSVEQWRSRLPE